MSVNAGGELRICGMPQAFSEATALGRLIFFDGRERDGERSIVYFWSVEALRGALIQRGESFFAAMAAAVCDFHTPDRLLGALSELGTPYFLLPEGEVISRTMEGRLALLDSRRGELIIDPRFDTLCTYSHADSTRSVRREVRKSCFYKDVSILSSAEYGLICRCEDLLGEGDLFERSADLAEELCRSSLTLTLDLPATESDEESFCNCAEAVFRAAVYGNVSLMIKGVRSPIDAEYALRLLHGCFCRLLREGREFNGYIAKGFLIDSPALLSELRHLPRCDFLCFDFSRLSERLVGKESKRSPRLCEALRIFWETWTRDNDVLCRATDLRALCREEDMGDLFWDWVELMNIGEVCIEGGCWESESI